MIKDILTAVMYSLGIAVPIYIADKGWLSFLPKDLDLLILYLSSAAITMGALAINWKLVRR